MTAFMAWLKETRGLDFAGYAELWHWSVTDLEGFWQAIWDYNDIVVERPPTAVLGKKTMPGAEWFPGASLNYAENVLHRERPGEVALYYHSETTPVTALYWDELGKNVRVLATQLYADGEITEAQLAGYLGTDIVGARRVYQQMTETRDISDDGAFQIVDLAEAAG